MNTLTNNLTAFSFFIIAGIINGSFPLFIKYMHRWRFENIWLQFSLWAYLIFPWLCAFILTPQIFNVYKQSAPALIWIMIIFGFLFGVGQVCFMFAMNMIGIGLAFVINIGLGVALGFSVPLVIQHPERLLTPEGITIIIGATLAVIGIIYSNSAGQLRDQEKSGVSSDQTKTQKHYFWGVLLAVFAGITSGGENVGFSLTTQMQQLASNVGASHIGASLVMWPGFLLCSFIPYLTYMLILNIKNKSFNNYAPSQTYIYHVYAIIMGLFWFGSLIFYSAGSSIVGKLGPIIGWPVFMILIILSSNFWGWKRNEWDGCSERVLLRLSLGLSTLMLAILALAFAQFISTLA